jgi:dipeptidyl aminopeptidase/acylaminoacyl peptidase
MVARSRVVTEPRWSAAGTSVAWVESFASRTDLLVAAVDRSTPPVVVTADVPVSAVGAYGGGVFCWAGAGDLVYAAADGRLLRIPSTGGPPVVLHEGGRVAAPSASPDATRVAFVVEREDSCDIAVVPVDASRWAVRLSTGADYCFDPSWSPDGRRVVWHEWDLPNMPWDASRVALCDLETSAVSIVAGGDDVATGQPRFSPDGARLAYTSDATGWTNVWVARADGSHARPLLDEPAEHAEPTWGPGQRSFAWSPDSQAIALCRNEDGFGRLVVVAVDDAAQARTVGRGWHHALDWSRAGLTCVRSGSRTPPQVVVVDPYTDGARDVLARGAVGGFPLDAMPEPESVTWRNDDAAVDVHGLLWRPWHDAPASRAADGRPPLLVMVHGGPHGQSVAGWAPRAFFYLSRGWAVLMPNARGSTGYGRTYAQALTGGWGDVDLADVAAGIRHAKHAGWCDPERVAVTGGSAGGFTVLQLCTRHPELVRAGVSLFGVTDLFDLAATTHRFESRYLDRIVGELPEHAARYRDRSPVTYARDTSVPVLVLQGDADKVVPKAQADLMVDAMRAGGATVEYHVYEGEGHGWSRPETIGDELTRAEHFLAEWVLRR